MPEEIKCARFMRVVSVAEPGVIEFKAWKNAKFVGIWQRPFNEKSTKPHLIFMDCPGEAQITYRMLILEGQAQVPHDESWVPFGFSWQTRKSFGTLWLSASNRKKTAEPERGATKAREAKPDKIPPVPIEEEEAAYTP